MYNLYHGNSGRAQRMPENTSERQNMHPDRQNMNSTRTSTGNSGGNRRQKSGRPGPDMLEQLTSALPRKLAELDTEDIILLLILYLMYRDSGDTEFLIIMGAMFLL